MRTISLLVVLLALSAPALAQTRVFVSGDVFADHKRLSGLSSEGAAPETTSAGGGASVGAQVSPRWDVRGEFQLGSTSTLTEPLMPSVSAFEVRNRNQMSAYSALIGFSPAVSSGVRLTVLGGLTFLHSTTDVDSIPAGLAVTAHTTVDNVAAPTIGAEVAIVLASHVSIVPALRVHAFTLRTDGTSGFAIRPGVGIRWMR